jgi:hypothetical protein
VQNFSSNYQEMNFLEGGDNWDVVVSNPARVVITLIALLGVPPEWPWGALAWRP